MGDVEGLIDGWAVGTGRGGSYLGPLRSSTLCWAIVAKRIKEVDGFRGIQKFWRDAKDFDACCSLTCRERMFIDVIVMITWEWSTKLTAGDDAMGMIMMKTNPRVSLVFNTRQCCGVTLRRGLLLLLLLFVFVFIINFLPCLFVEQCWSLTPCCSEAACVFCIMYFVCTVHHPLL